MKKLIAVLAKSLKYSDDYLSHETALFFHGMIGEIPDQITVVSSHRRRSKTLLNKHQLQYIYRQGISLNQLTQKVVNDYRIQISSFELTLIDLLSRSSPSLQPEKMAQLFTLKTINTEKLIAIAKATSVSALKRCLFWLAWAGKITYSHIPQLPRSPVMLDHRFANEPHGTEGHLFIQFPLRFLEFTITESDNSWIELRNSKAFRQFCRAEQWLPIKDDPRPRSRRKLTKFCTSLFSELAQKNKNRIPLLQSIIYRRSHADLPQSLPAWCIDWIQSTGSPVRTFPWLMTFVKDNLNSENPDAAECAAYFGLKLKMHAEVAEAIKITGPRMLLAEKYQIVEYLCKELVKYKIHVPAMAYILLGRISQMHGREHEAIELLQAARKLIQSESAHAEDIGSLTFAFAGIYMRQQKFELAEAEFAKAETFLKDSNNLLLRGGLAQMRGNLHYMQDNLNQAMKHYRSALQIFLKLDLPRRLESLYHNLAKVEERKGRYLQSHRYYCKGIEICRNLGLSYQQSLSMAAHGATMLNMGNFKIATRLLSEAYSLICEISCSNPILKTETIAMLAWAYEASGQHLVAQSLWDELKFAPDDTKGFLPMYIPAVKAAVFGNLKLAHSILTAIPKKLPEIALKPEQHGNLLFITGLIEYFHDISDSQSTLSRAQSLLSQFHESDNRRLLKVFLWFFPQKKPRGEFPEKQLQELVHHRAYTPFWFYFAPQMAKMSNVECNKFLAHHLRSSSQPFINRIAAWNKEFASYMSSQTFKEHAGKRLLHCRPQASETVDEKQYIRLKQLTRQTSITFDFIEGTISLGNHCTNFRTNTYPFRLLTELIIENFAPLPCAKLFSRVWNREFDSEIDECSIKSATYRLRKQLSPFFPRIQVCEASINRSKHIQIKVTGDWQAFIPVML